MKRILVTGATGKLGRVFIDSILGNPQYDDFIVRALCYHRKMDTQQRLEVVYGSMENQDDVQFVVEKIDFLKNSLSDLSISRRMLTYDL